MKYHILHLNLVPVFNIILCICLYIYIYLLYYLQKDHVMFYVLYYGKWQVPALEPSATLAATGIRATLQSV